MAAEQCFCLRWNNYQSSVVGDLRSLLEQEEFVDVTIACEGKRIKAHRLMLSACSNYFKYLLKENPSDHPIIFLRDVRFWELESIMDFIYNGQVNVMQDQLPGFIRTAEALQIKGLAAVNNNNNLHMPKMYDFKHFQEMLLRQDNKDPKYPFSPHSDLLNPENINKLVPPLIPPAKKHRYDNGQVNIPAVYREVHLSKNANNSDSHTDSHRKELKSYPVEDSQQNCEKKLYKEIEEVTDGKTDRLSSPDDKIENIKTEHSGSSRSATPEEDRPEFEEDRSSHEGSITSWDSLNIDWNSTDQPSPLSMAVNEAGLPVCKVCGKAFKHQGSLVAHYQVHQQRTKCPVCKKVLSRHYHMKVHLLTVHKVPDSEIESLLRSQNIA